MQIVDTIGRPVEDKPVAASKKDIPESVRQKKQKERENAEARQLDKDIAEARQLAQNSTNSSVDTTNSFVETWSDQDQETFLQTALDVLLPWRSLSRTAMSWLNDRGEDEDEQPSTTVGLHEEGRGDVEEEREDFSPEFTAPGVGSALENYETEDSSSEFTPVGSLNYDASSYHPEETFLEEAVSEEELVKERRRRQLQKESVKLDRLERLTRYTARAVAAAESGADYPPCICPPGYKMWQNAAGRGGHRD